MIRLAFGLASMLSLSLILTTSVAAEPGPVSPPAISPPTQAQVLPVSPRWAGADFVPFTIHALVPVAPATRVDIRQVLSGRRVHCGSAITQPVAYAVADRSVLTAAIERSCANGPVQVAHADTVVAAFEAPTATAVKAAGLILNQAQAAEAYGWPSEGSQADDNLFRRNAAAIFTVFCAGGAGIATVWLYRRRRTGVTLAPLGR
jgi:hypothetical protein